eukprot:symbB.v1.2.033012.t1/scaffold4043.1/size45695/1
MARRSWLLRLSAPLVLLTALKLSFVGISQSRSPLVPRRGEGFETSAPSPKVKSTISREQLERDHGDSWQMVDKILKGERAESPEADFVDGKRCAKVYSVEEFVFCLTITFLQIL